jgi:hypothetical protein
MSARVVPYSHPKFSRALFEKHDQPAKEVGKSLLKQMGYTITDETEAYGSHDFIVEKGGKEFKVEVEQKMGWRTRLFPFSTHHVSFRKNTSCADIFIQISANEKYVAMCPMSVVKTSPVVRKDTCFGTVQEPYFSVSVSNMQYYTWEDGAWYEEIDD